METIEVLRGARKLLEVDRAWRKHAFAGTDPKHECPTLSEEATCFCLAGAMYRVMGVRPSDNAGVINDAVKVLGFSSRQRLIEWNDKLRRTHKDIVARLDTAITKLETANGNG